MGSDFWKELDPRGDAQIPGGQDGNDFFFLMWDHVTGGKIDLQGTEFLRCVPDHLPRPDSFWILRVQNPNAGRPRLNLSLVHCPTPSASQIKNPKIELIWDRSDALSEDNFTEPFKKPSWGTYKPSPPTCEEPKLQPLRSLGCSNSSGIPGKSQQRFSCFVLGSCNILSVSSPAEGQKMLGVGVLCWNSSRLEHFGGTDTKPSLVCLSLFLFLPLSGWDLLLLRGGGCQPRFLLVSLIQMNLEENSSQQPPGMCGGGWSSGWFFSQSLPWVLVWKPRIQMKDWGLR